MYPLKFTPIYKQKIWGGRNLEQVFDRTLPPGAIGESWEISAYNDDLSEVSNGKFKGKTLLELLAFAGRDILGPDIYREHNNDFPLLVKIIDAAEQLSVQVHPDDAYARRHENGQQGKSELWYVLSADPEAEIVYGLQEDVTAEKFKQAIAGGEVESCLNYVEVKAGDSFYIPAGTVHSIGAGIMIAEIQQTSDLTYRVYDWDRTDESGRGRELHIDKALEVINFQAEQQLAPQAFTEQEPGPLERPLVRSPYFRSDLVEVEDGYQASTGGESFHVLLNVAGRPVLTYPGGEEELQPGQTLLLPAALGEYTVEGKAKFIKSYL